MGEREENGTAVRAAETSGKMKEWAEEAARWKNWALEAAEIACFHCEEYAGRGNERCNGCRIMRIKNEAG